MYLSILTFTFYDRGGKQERIVTTNPETCMVSLNVHASISDFA
jgi:hypothetical protein